MATGATTQFFRFSLLFFLLEMRLSSSIFIRCTSMSVFHSTSPSEPTNFGEISFLSKKKPPTGRWDSTRQSSFFLFRNKKKQDDFTEFYWVYYRFRFRFWRPSTLPLRADDVASKNRNFFWIFLSVKPSQTWLNPMKTP